MHAHTVLAARLSSALGEIHAREVVVPVETATAAEGRDGRDDALSPLELLLAAVAGGVLAGVEQAAAALSFHLDGATVEVCGVFAGHSTKSLAVEYDLTLQTDECDSRLGQFHERVRHGEALLCLGHAGAHLTGRVRRAAAGAAARTDSPSGWPPSSRGRDGGSAAAAAASPRR